MISSPLLVVTIAAGFIYVFSQAIRNLYINPLRKYPGPLLDRMTYMVKAYHILRGDNVFYLQKLHKKYGQVVRVSPTELSYIGVQAWKDIYAHSTTSESGNLPKDPRSQREEKNGALTIFTAEEADHRRIRRVQNHMFSEKAIAAQVPLIRSYIDLLISNLHEKAKDPSTDVVDLVEWYTFTTFDIVGELAFGESFGCLRSNALHSWIKNSFLFVKDAQKWFACNQLTWPLNKLAYRLTPSETRSALYETNDFAREKSRARMEQDSVDRVDFMSYILKHNDEKGMTKPEIENNARTLILAGSETTSSFLSGLTFHLLTNPQHLVKLTSLIRDTFSSASETTASALCQLEYLDVIIDESFRLYPPATITSARSTSVGGKVICGEVMPDNTTVSVPILAANTSPDFWTDPDDFVPERWYKDDRCPEKYRSDERKVMQPFSMGPRNCVGKHMAKQEIRLIIASMLWNFDLELQPESFNWKKDQKIFGLWERSELKVRLIPRDYTD